MRFVREANPGRDRDVVLNGAEAGDVAIRVNLDSVPDRAGGVDDRVVTDTTVVAHPRVLAYHDVDAGLKPVADADAVVHGGPTTDDPTSPDLEAAARPSRAGLSTEPDVVLDEGASTDLDGGRKRSAGLTGHRRTLRISGFDVSPSHGTEPCAAK